MEKRLTKKEQKAFLKILGGVGDSSMITDGKFVVVSNSAFALKQGKKIVEYAPKTISSFDIVLESLLKSGESPNHISGEEMLSRAHGELRGRCLGHNDAVWLVENQRGIPVEFRKWHLAFFGTVWQDPKGYRFASSMLYVNKEWGIYSVWLVHPCGPSMRIACRP